MKYWMILDSTAWFWECMRWYWMVLEWVPIVWKTVCGCPFGGDLGGPWMRANEVLRLIKKNKRFVGICRLIIGLVLLSNGLKWRVHLNKMVIHISNNYLLLMDSTF